MWTDGITGTDQRAVACTELSGMLTAGDSLVICAVRNDYHDDFADWRTRVEDSVVVSDLRETFDA